jgi:hypothetical protein
MTIQMNLGLKAWKILDILEILVFKPVKLQWKLQKSEKPETLC